MTTQNKKLRFMLLLAVALILSLSGCGKEDDSVATTSTTENTDIDTIEILELPYNVHECVRNYAYFNTGTNKILIINSQESFDELFPECTAPIDVDFSSKSMVAAFGVCNCFVESHATIEHGDNDDITITITVIEGYCAAITSFFETYTCPKITDDQNFSLNIKYKL